MTNKSTDKKVAVISGGAGYLGSAITESFVADGYVVVIISDKDSADFKNNDSVFLFKADISDLKAVSQIAHQVKDKLGLVTTIVHAAAAPLVRQTILLESPQDFALQFAVNVSGAFNLYKAFFLNMTSNASFIGITSQAIESGSHSSSGSYIPAKLALRGLLRVMFRENIATGLRVYAVAPAFMPGGLNSDIPDQVMDFIKKKSQPEDITKPQEVAQAVLDLAHDEAKKMNGQSMSVPGRQLTDL